jgi:putative membrane protein
MFHGTGWWFFGMHLFWWVFWIGLLSVAFATVTPVPRTLARSGERALDILRRRYAAGQFSTEEYERRKAVLERDEPRRAAPSSGHSHR